MKKTEHEDRPVESRHRNTEIEIQGGFPGHHYTEPATPSRASNCKSGGTMLGASPFEIKYRNIR
jgi:hypothetical protein